MSVKTLRRDSPFRAGSQLATELSAAGDIGVAIARTDARSPSRTAAAAVPEFRSTVEKEVSLGHRPEPSVEGSRNLYPTHLCGS